MSDVILHCICIAPKDVLISLPAEERTYRDEKAGWPPGVQMPGTKVVLGRVAVHIVYAGPKEDFYAAKPADWTVKAMQDEHIIPWQDNGKGLPKGVYVALSANFADFLEDVITVAEDGSEISQRPSVPCPLHTFAGADQWWWEGTPLADPPVVEE